MARVGIALAWSVGKNGKPNMRARNCVGGGLDNHLHRIASFSGGKDSTAMVLKLVEEKMIDMAVYCHVGLDFPEIEENVEKVRVFLKENGVGFVKLCAQHSFEYYLLEKEVKSKKYGVRHGVGWAGIKSRWCTAFLKTKVLDKFRNMCGKDTIYYIGIASDEVHRTQRRGADSSERKYPLVEWGMTEADCLKYCKDRGFLTGRIYDLTDRASCWCCPFQCAKSLKMLYHEFPDLWRKLEEWDSKVENNVCSNITFNGRRVRDWKVKFDREDLAEKEQKKLSNYGVMI